MSAASSAGQQQELRPDAMAAECAQDALASTTAPKRTSLPVDDLAGDFADMRFARHNQRAMFASAAKAARSLGHGSAKKRAKAAQARLAGGSG